MSRRPRADAYVRKPLEGFATSDAFGELSRRSVVSAQLVQILKAAAGDPELRERMLGILDDSSDRIGATTEGLSRLSMQLASVSLHHGAQVIAYYRRSAT